MNEGTMTATELERRNRQRQRTVVDERRRLNALQVLVAALFGSGGMPMRMPRAKRPGMRVHSKSGLGTGERRVKAGRHGSLAGVVMGLLVDGKGRSLSMNAREHDRRQKRARARARAKKRN